MQMKFIWLIFGLVSSFALTGCVRCDGERAEEEKDPPDFTAVFDPLPTPTIGVAEFPTTTEPEPPAAESPDLSLTIDPPQPLLGVSNFVQLANELPEKNDPANFMTIMGQNGAVVTVWALAQRNWLWAYPPLETHYFGNIRNWRVERVGQEFFRFVNQQLNSCIEAYSNGVIHNRCAKSNLAQSFELLPTSSGTVFLKNVQQQRCLTTNTASTTGYFTLTLEPCSDNLDPSKDQNWLLAPPLMKATPQN